ncbi:MAG: hypothetical protein J6M24_01790 [Lachnospiraceae bacterium]|nr:hypothetical protein [Lachnospiraceae bacterium]
MKKAWLKLTGLVLAVALFVGAACAIHYTGSGEYKNAYYSGTLNGSVGNMGYYGGLTTPSSATSVSTSGRTWWAVADVKEYSQYSPNPLNSGHYACTVSSSNISTGLNNCKISRAPSNVYYRYEHEGSLSVPGQGVTPNTFKFTAYQH